MWEYDPKSPVDMDRMISLLKNQIYLIGEPWCYLGGGQAVMGQCPTHHGDSCLRTPEGLVEMLSEHVDTRTPYDPNFGDEKVCKCGHPYHRHFDSYEDNEPVGCKYCHDPRCSEFEEAPSGSETPLEHDLTSFAIEDIDLDFKV